MSVGIMFTKESGTAMKRGSVLIRPCSKSKGNPQSLVCAVHT